MVKVRTLLDAPADEEMTCWPASHLSHAERRKVVETGRKALNSAGLEHQPLLVGTGGSDEYLTEGCLT